ncbi:MAG: hypothetical protein JXK07_15145 [Spirochaetes bacterium]|nr:hypothetical protein [Spirochaetota bacterium]MBN2771657.1 hypothetical protein [Spirochaetota bacterium]
MRLILFIISFCIITPLSILVHHYGTLFMMKTEYTRDDFTNLDPVKTRILKRLGNTPNRTITIIVSFAALVLPYFLTATMLNWFINSVILYALFYYARFLLLPKNEDTGLPFDIDLVMIVFGFSLLAGFTLNWISFMNTGFLFFAVNFFATIILLYYSLTLFFNQQSKPVSKSGDDSSTVQINSKTDSDQNGENNE